MKERTGTDPIRSNKTRSGPAAIGRLSAPGQAAGGGGGGGAVGDFGSS
jgi:hypothetical protein